MNKEQVVNKLKQLDCPSGIAEVVCNIALSSDNPDASAMVRHNESILVSIRNGKTDDAINDDLCMPNKHWCVCDSIEDFEKRVTDTAFCKISFKEVRPFVSDFSA